MNSNVHTWATALALMLVSNAVTAQIAPPNEQGVAMGEIDVNTANPSAQQALWNDILGLQKIRIGDATGVKMPGAIVLFRPRTAIGPSDGTTINHVGLFVENIEPYLSKLLGARLVYTVDPGPKQIMIIGPDGLKVELTADGKPGVRFHHLHYYVPDAQAAQVWYAQNFGATKARRAIWDAGNLPGANLTFLQSQAATVGTAGRALDSIGFEVRELKAFVERMQAQGVSFDEPYAVSATGLRRAVLTDPWGTRIVLTEGLGAAAN